MPWVSMNWTAWCGEIACRIAGSSLMCMMPSTAIATNHTTQIGPNSFDTAAVPRACTANRPINMASVIRMIVDVGMSGTMAGTDFNPSTADSTDKAGVRIASP